VNEAYATYDSLTSDGVRDAANRYFVDSQRVTLTLSEDPAMEGIDGKASLDDLVAARGMAESAPVTGEQAAYAELVVAESATAAPVAFISKPSASSPLVDVSFLVHAGSGFDPDGKKGLAAMTAALLTDGGSEALTIEEINEAMYPMAAGFSAQVDKEMTRLSGQVHRDNLADWYSLVRGQLLFPAWSESDFERVRTNLINGIRTDLVGNNDEELAKEYLYSELYGAEHPYGSYNLGTVSDLESITLDDLRQFYKDYYTVANITIGISGGYPEDLPATISKDLQKLDAGVRAMLPLPAAPLPEGRKAVLIEKETPGVAVSFGFPIELKRGDPDWVALWLARSYIGEHRSFNSHLYQRIRETRGMNYGDYAYVEYFPRGMFQFHPDTNLGRQQQIFQVWLRPLRDNNDAHFATRTAMFELEKMIEDGISESDFEATRAYLSKFVALLTDGQSRQLGYAMDSQYYGIDNFSDYVREGLANLTLADVNRVIRENLDLENVQYVYITKDAGDLSERLVNNEVSPMSYEADKPQALLDEDAAISTIDLGFSTDDVRIVPAAEVFN
jgi:zinc protease